MNLYDSPDDDGLAEIVHERHEQVEHHKHEHDRAHKTYQLEIDEVIYRWEEAYVTGVQILALAGRTREHEALHVGPGDEQAEPLPADSRFYLGTERMHRFRTRLIRR